MSLGINVNSDPESNSPQNIWAFLFPQYMHAIVLQTLSEWRARLLFSQFILDLRTGSGLRLGEGSMTSYRADCLHLLIICP